MIVFADNKNAHEEIETWFKQNYKHSKFDGSYYQ